MSLARQELCTPGATMRLFQFLKISHLFARLNHTTGRKWWYAIHALGWVGVVSILAFSLPLLDVITPFGAGWFGSFLRTAEGTTILAYGQYPIPAELGDGYYLLVTMAVILGGRFCELAIMISYGFSRGEHIVHHGPGNIFWGFRPVT